jgi:hypothetical protein
MFAFPQIGHFTLNNAKNNAVAMRELESLLAARKTAIAVGFDHLNHCVRCYAHIINICSSHIISSVTSIPKPHISGLKVPAGSNVRSNNLDDSDAHRVVTLTQAVTLNSSIWRTSTTTQTLNLILGWWASNVTLFSVLKGLFVS